MKPVDWLNTVLLNVQYHREGTKSDCTFVPRCTQISIQIEVDDKGCRHESFSSKVDQDLRHHFGYGMLDAFLADSNNSTNLRTLFSRASLTPWIFDSCDVKRIAQNLWAEDESSLFRRHSPNRISLSLDGGEMSPQQQ